MGDTRPKREISAAYTAYKGDKGWNMEYGICRIYGPSGRQMSRHKIRPALREENGPANVTHRSAPSADMADAMRTWVQIRMRDQTSLTARPPYRRRAAIPTSELAQPDVAEADRLARITVALELDGAVAVLDHTRQTDSQTGFRILFRLR